VIRTTREIDGIDWAAAAEVIRLAPLGTRDPARLERAFRNSYVSVFAFDEDTLVGLGRATCDGEFQACIYDVVVLPAYQGQGVGRQVVHELLKCLPVKNIILYAVPGKESFYAKLGFRAMRTAMAQLSPGMSLPEAGYLEAPG
jgi:predicted N-acetyltransferase YhbS